MNNNGPFERPHDSRSAAAAASGGTGVFGARATATKCATTPNRAPESRHVGFFTPTLKRYSVKYTNDVVPSCQPCNMLHRVRHQVLIPSLRLPELSDNQKLYCRTAPHRYNFYTDVGTQRSICGRWGEPRHFVSFSCTTGSSSSSRGRMRRTTAANSDAGVSLGRHRLSLIEPLSARRSTDRPTDRNEIRADGPRTCVLQLAVS